MKRQCCVRRAIDCCNGANVRHHSGWHEGERVVLYVALQSEIQWEIRWVALLLEKVKRFGWIGLNSDWSTRPASRVRHVVIRFHRETLEMSCRTATHAPMSPVIRNIYLPLIGRCYGNSISCWSVVRTRDCFLLSLNFAHPIGCDANFDSTNVPNVHLDDVHV
jgi:hypothetical protein